jgi:ATP-dependent Clp protease adaptor protein ClpS
MPDETPPTPPKPRLPAAPRRRAGRGRRRAQGRQHQAAALYQVVMLNDDYTPMEFVVMVLQHYFQRDLDTATASC